MRSDFLVYFLSRVDLGGDDGGVVGRVLVLDGYNIRGRQQ